MESPNNSSQPVVVDDASQNQWLSYNGDWTHLFGLAAPANGTLTYTTTLGATVVFTFNGTAVGVAGTIVPANNGATPPTTTYSIDGQLLETYTPPTNVTEQTNAVSFFVKNSLAATTHTLTINVTSINPNAPFLIDYVAYLPLPPSPTSSTGPSSTAGGVPTGQNNSPPQSSSSTPVGAIVGGVVGGVVLIALTILAFWWFLRKKRREEYIYDTASAADILRPETAQYGNTPASFAGSPQPFDPTVGAFPYASQTLVAGGDELPLGHTEPFIGAPLAQVPSRTSFAGQPLPSGKAAAMQQPVQPVQEPAIYHADSGVRFTPAGPSEPVQAPAPPPPPTVLSDDIPPLYTEH